MTAVVSQGRPRPRFRIGKRALPYVLSLPALLVCIAILVPFLTAVWYSLHRYRLSQPWGYKPDNPMIPWGNWRLKADVENEWMRDRSLEKTKLFLGIYSNPLQDSAVQVTMGALYDRTKEYLGTTDKAIIAFRRLGESLSCSAS